MPKWWGRDAQIVFEADSGTGSGSQPGAEQQGGEMQPGSEGEKPDLVTLQAELAKAQSALKEANREAAERRKKLQTYEADEQQRKAAQMSEAEKAQAALKQAEALQAELRKTRADYAVAKAAAKLGIDVKLAARLVDVEFDDAGQPVNVEAALTATLTEHPYLRPAAASNPANPQRLGKLTLDDVRKMTPEQINARWDEVQAAMKAAGQ